MAREIDELNELGSQVIDYEDYFGEMELTDEEKEKRIELAKKFEVLFLFFLLAYSKQQKIDYESMIYEKYILIALEFLKQDKVPAYVDDYARQLADDVVKTTIEHDGEEFYTSTERGMLISANEANALGNYNQQAQAIKAGMKYKTWLTEKDNKVRHTHREVDNVTIGIFESFQVGDSLMMFPKDTSLGASVEEIAGCRCVAKYS